MLCHLPFLILSILGLTDSSFVVTHAVLVLRCMSPYMRLTNK